MINGKSLALFDFDGTITTRDTLFEFILYVKGPARFAIGMLMLSPVLILHTARLISGQRAKERLLQYFFKGSTLTEFQSYCDKFSKQRIPWLLRKGALNQITSHLHQGDRVVVVSASPENWVSSWAKMNGLEWIATRLDSDNGVLTGKILGKNCNGTEKVSRINDYLDLSEYANVYTYGDSKGDLPLLALGTSRSYKPFR